MNTRWRDPTKMLQSVDVWFVGGPMHGQAGLVDIDDHLFQYQSVEYRRHTEELPGKRLASFFCDKTDPAFPAKLDEMRAKAMLGQYRPPAASSLQ